MLGLCLMKRLLALLFIFPALPVLAQAVPLTTPAEKEAAHAIDANLLRGHVRFLAHDLLEGRGPGTRGDALAQAYIASQFETAGLKPGGEDGTYLQPFELVGITGHPETLTFSTASAHAELKFHDDFIAVSGVQEPEARLEDSELVFVGYGIVAPEYAWDDFKGMDLRGKTLLILNNDPADDPNLFAGRTRLWYGRWDYKYEQAAKLGAAGAIIIHTTPSAGYPVAGGADLVVGRAVRAARHFGATSPGEGLDHRGRHAAHRPSGGQDLDALVRRGAEARLPARAARGEGLHALLRPRCGAAPTANVLGVLPGSDPKLAQEVVLYTAHHDHLGMKEDAKPGEDAIYNGAVDNASGVAALLAVARAFQALPKPPRRTILFAAVAAEEQGLLGSQYLADAPARSPGPYRRQHQHRRREHPRPHARRHRHRAGQVQPRSPPSPGWRRRRAAP